MKIRLLFALLVALGLSCMENGGTGSEIGNARSSALLYNEDGSPAAGAKVLFIPVEYAPNNFLSKTLRTAICSTVTNNDGGYDFNNVPGGVYNIFGVGEPNRSFQDSVPVAGGVAEVVPDTLKPVGSFTAHIGLSNGLAYKSLLVIVFGSMHSSFIDSTGTFSLSDMPQGDYPIRILTTLDDWEPKDTVLSIKSGADDTLTDTMRLKYNGVPGPTGFGVLYDTLRQTSVLTWDPVDTALISGFNIYRSVNDGNFSLITKAPLPETTVVYYDTDLTVGKVYEYRLVSRNGAGKESDFIDIHGDAAEVVQSSLATTTLSLKSANTVNDTASVNDTVACILTYKNSTRKTDRIEWFINQSDSAIAVKRDCGLSGTDTLIIFRPAAELLRIHANVTDEADTTWKDSILIAIIQDAPLVSISGDSSVPINTTVQFHADVSQTFGNIVDYKWRNSLDAVSGVSTDSVYTCIFPAETTVTLFVEVEDDDGNHNASTKTITVTNDKPVIRGLNKTTVSINDTLTFTVEASDSNGCTPFFYWKYDFDGIAHYDTTEVGSISYTSPSEPQKCTVTLTVSDSLGKTAAESVVVDVILDPPVVDAGNDTSVSTGSLVVLRGSATDFFGTIVQYKWDFNGDGTWDDSSATTDSTSAVYDDCGIRKVVFGAIDDDGNFITDTLHVDVTSHIGGTVFDDMTLLKNRSPYQLTSNLQIAEGAVLIIEAGVTVNVNTGSSIQIIGGTLTAEGAPDDSIRFVSHGGNTAFEFKNSNDSLSHLSYATFIGFDTAVCTNTPNATSTCRIAVSNNRFSGTKIFNRGSKLILTDCRIEKTIVKMTDIDSLSNCIVDNTSFQMDCCSPDLFLNSSTVTNSKIVVLKNGGVTLTIHSSTLKNVPITLPMEKVAITNSTLNNCPIQLGNGTIKKSLFSGNTTDTGFVLNSWNLKMDSSVIKDFGTGITIRRDFEERLVTINATNFINIATYAIRNDSTSTVTAINCYWDTAVEDQIKGKIYDYYDNINRGKVLYTPFSNTPFGFRIEE